MKITEKQTGELNMSGKKKNNAAKKTGNKKSAQSAKNTQNTKSAQNVNNTPNTENTSNTRNTQKAKTARSSTSKSAAKKKASKKVFWLSLALCVSLAINIALIVVLAIGYKSDSNKDTSGIGASATGSADTGSADTGLAGTGAVDTDISNTDIAGTDISETDMFLYSEGIDANGFWENTTALNYVELFDYLSFSIPREVHEVSDIDLQSGISRLLANYSPETQQITNRAVIDGDTVNIDYVGSVDGVVFDGGSTGGGGTEVTAGSTDYIDDFLIQIIGHMPGETMNVEVTFPEVYSNNPDLAGKDAVFVTTINYIVETVITDGFVEENLSADFGWKTVSEMEENVREELQRAAIENFIREYMATKVTYYEIPDYILGYQEKRIEFEERNLLETYQEYADMYGMDLDTFLQFYVGVSGTDELAAQNRNNVIGDITCSLASQAVAENAGISVSDGDMEYYLPDFSSYESQYGMPWLKQYVLGRKVLEFIIENAAYA